jgi:hypothetical protein
MGKYQDLGASHSIDMEYLVATMATRLSQSLYRSLFEIDLWASLLGNMNIEIYVERLMRAWIATITRQLPKNFKAELRRFERRPFVGKFLHFQVVACISIHSCVIYTYAHDVYFYSIFLVLCLWNFPLWFSYFCAQCLWICCLISPWVVSPWLVDYSVRKVLLFFCWTFIETIQKIRPLYSIMFFTCVVYLSIDRAVISSRIEINN